MHKPPPLPRATPLRQLLRDLEPFKCLHPLLRLGFLAHGNPRIRDEDVGVFDGFFGDVGFGQFESGVCGCDDVAHEGRDGVAFGGCYGDFDAEFGGANSEVEEDVVGVADPGDFEAFES